MKNILSIGFILVLSLVSCTEDINYKGNIEFTFKNFDLSNSYEITPEIFSVSDLDHPIRNNLSVENTGILNVNNLLMGTYVIMYTVNSGWPHYRFGKAFQVFPDETAKILIDANKDRDL